MSFVITVLEVFGLLVAGAAVVFVVTAVVFAVLSNAGAEPPLPWEDDEAER